VEKKLLVHESQHKVVEAEEARVYTVEVFKGKAFRKGKYEFNGTDYEQVVEIKAFRIVVREEIITPIGTEQHSEPLDFNFCCSRSGDFRYVTRVIAEQCKTLNDVRYLMADLEDRFAATMDRDAKFELKKQLGLYNQKPAPVVRTNKQYKPLPQIKRP
jgi:hypothetical protein